MTSLTDEQIAALKAAALAATPQNIDSAQRIEYYDDGSHVECPACGGEGHVELEADFCNYDGTAIGVQFYGIGNAHGAAEAYLRAAMPTTVLALIDRLERAEAALLSASKGAAPWIAHWAGSNPYKGWSIRQGRDEVIWFGESISSETVEGIVLAHNKCFDCEGAGCVMNCSGLRPAAPAQSAQRAAEPVAWERLAVAWLRGRAAAQDQNNERWPEHAKAYDRWRYYVTIAQVLADELEGNGRRPRDSLDPAPQPSQTAVAPVESTPRYEVKYAAAVGEPFWATVSFKEYEDSRMNGSPVRRVTPPCQGINCGCTDGVSHSLECEAEHAAAVASDTYIKTNPSAVVLDDERAAGLVEALEETQGLLAAMLHETRPADEIALQLGDNRTALKNYARAASPQSVAQPVEQTRALPVGYFVFDGIWQNVSEKYKTDLDVVPLYRKPPLRSKMTYDEWACTYADEISDPSARRAAWDAARPASGGTK